MITEVITEVHGAIASFNSLKTSVISVVKKSHHKSAIKKFAPQAFNAYTIIFTPNFVLSSLKKRLFLKS